MPRGQIQKGFCAARQRGAPLCAPFANKEGPEHGHKLLAHMQPAGASGPAAGGKPGSKMQSLN